MVAPQHPARPGRAIFHHYWSCLVPSHQILISTGQRAALLQMQLEFTVVYSPAGSVGWVGAAARDVAERREQEMAEGWVSSASPRRSHQGPEGAQEQHPAGLPQGLGPNPCLARIRARAGSSGQMPGLLLMPAFLPPTWPWPRHFLLQKSPWQTQQLLWLLTLDMRASPSLPRLAPWHLLTLFPVNGGYGWETPCRHPPWVPHVR